ncbi:restriction endonuclease subunit S [Streptococcus ruminantium]|uniref:restriction endonuclease subunit S n=2 Tax=Streptococcus ruminantium TaxID=1917441 RepID=UPI0013EEFFD3|nr:restriction endonuclease subunit S [Streptococcus ruminantium]
MTYIDEMMKELCPDGVEWKELGEVCEIQRGIRITKNQLLPSGYPVVSGGTGYMGYTDSYNREAETITIAQYGTAGYVNIQKERFWANDVCFSVYPKDVLVNKYLYYVLANKQEYLYSISNRTAVPYSISKNNILKIKIPLPPLEIQEEIVKILDKFTDYVTELTAELTAELTLRQQQYSFYRDKLLSFDEDSSGGANNKVYTVQWKTLGEVAENLDSQRKPVTKGNRSSGNYPYYGASGIVDYVDDYIFDGDYLLVSEDGANLIARKTPIAFSISGKSWVNNHAHILRFDDAIDQKYVGYYLNYIDLTPYISGAAQPKLNQQNLNSIKIPYPNQAIRNKIVQMLDNFDTVCNDLNIGLPKEIELRQKQYEFFRDKLLTFTAEGVYTDSTVQTRPN